MAPTYHSYGGINNFQGAKCVNCGITYDLMDFTTWEGALCSGAEEQEEFDYLTKEPPKCECGAQKVFGSEPWTRIHSSWCPVFDEFIESEEIL